MARAFIVRPDPATGFATVTTTLREWLETADAAGRAIHVPPYARRQHDRVRTVPPQQAARLYAVEARPRRRRSGRRTAAPRGQPARAADETDGRVVDLVRCAERGVWQVDIGGAANTNGA